MLFALEGKAFPSRRDQQALNRKRKENERAIKASSLPSAMMEAPDSRFGESFLLLRKDRQTMYELGTGPDWPGVFRPPFTVEDLPIRAVRMFAMSIEGGLAWASAYLFCVIESLVRFLRSAELSQLAVVPESELEAEFDIEASRYALGPELHEVIAHTASVCERIWGT